ncbi:MAG: hypothetical protein AAF944_24025 [Bacteroidota bacterium]
MEAQIKTQLENKFSDLKDRIKEFRKNNYDKKLGNLLKQEHEEAIKKSGPHKGLLNNLAVILCELGQYHEAFNCIDEGIEEESYSTRQRYNRACFKYHKNLFDEAIVEVDRIEKGEGCYPEAQALKGKIQIERNNYEEASMAFNKAYVYSSDLKYLIWDGYACYLNAELLPKKKEDNEGEYKKRISMVIRKLERVKSLARKDHVNKRLLGVSLLFLGCFYSKNEDFMAAKYNLEESYSILEKEDTVLKNKCKDLLDVVWDRKLKPQWYNWWLKSPKILNGKARKNMFFTLITLLGVLTILLLSHPILNKYGGKYEFDWSIYLFMCGFIIIMLLLPNAESIKTGQFEVDFDKIHRLDGIPAPAQLEEALGEVNEKCRLNIEEG